MNLNFEKEIAIKLRSIAKEKEKSAPQATACEIIREESVVLTWYGLSIASTLIIGLALAALAATLYNRPRLIFSSS